MPEYRGIQVRLISHLDGTEFPELYPPLKEGFPVLHENYTISCYTTASKGTQFWIQYWVEEPTPPLGYFYFKLSVNGESVVSWGVAKKDNFRGKTAFAIYETVDGFGGLATTLERRGLFFAAEDKKYGTLATPRGRVVEVRVYRSKGRKRVPKAVQQFRSTAVGRRENGAVDFIATGQVYKDQPKRYYNYALSDPIDKPYGTFRYYCRTKSELEELGVFQAQTRYDSDESGLSVLYPESSEVEQGGQVDAPQDAEASVPEASSSRTTDECIIEDDEPVEEDNFGFVDSMRRLSIPPSRQLLPTTNSSFPVPKASKAKPAAEELEGTGEAPWLSRAPSPVKSEF